MVIRIVQFIGERVSSGGGERKRVWCVGDLGFWGVGWRFVVWVGGLGALGCCGGRVVSWVVLVR